MNTVWELGPFHIMYNFYNGFCIGIKTDTLYEAIVGENPQPGDKVEVEERAAWVLILPFIEIFITM